MRQTVIAFSLALVVGLPTYSQPTYGTDFTQLISGKNLPLILKLKDLDSKWRRMTLRDQSEMGEWLQLFGLISGALGSDVYYTKGQTVTVGSETYIVAYRLEANKVDFRALVQTDPNAKPFAPEVITPETTVALSLLNLQTLSSLNDILPFNLKQEIEASRQIRETFISSAPSSDKDKVCTPEKSKTGTPSTAR